MSPRRLWATARLDLAHNLRRPLFWIWLLILALSAWGLASGGMRISSGDSSVGGTKAFITSEFSMAMMLGMLVLLFHAFFVSVAAGMSVPRDEELRVGAVLHATPLQAREYAWGKFLAAWGSFVVVLALHVLFHAVANHELVSAEDADYVGPFVLANYLRPALVFGLPTITFLAGACFWIGVRTNRPILVFILPVALVMACAFLLWNFSPSWLPEFWNQFMIAVDPTGFRWLQENHLSLDRGAAYYNETPIPYGWGFLANRVVFLLAGFGFAWLAARRFALTVRGGHQRVKNAELTEPAPAQQAPATPRPLGALGMTGRRPGLLGGVAAVTRVEFRELLASPGMYLFLPIIVLETVANSLFFTGPFETPPLLTGGVLAVRGLGFLAALVCGLLLFYTVESLRREEGTGLAAIHHATPVRTGSILFGKALANALVGVVAIGATMITDLVILAAQGEAPADPSPFVLVWCVVLLPTFLVWTSFVSFLYGLVRSRYTTYALALGAFMWTSYVDETDGLSWAWNWPLWGALQWSDMGVFELVKGELILNRSLMLAATALFTVLTVSLFPRRQRDATGTLLRLRPWPLAKRAIVLSPLWLTVVVLWAVLDHRADSGFQGDAFDKLQKDYWRKNIQTYKDAPTPDLVGADIELELFPERRGFEVKGTFTLRNETPEALPTVLLTRGAGWTRPSSLPAPAEGEADGVAWSLDGLPFEPEDAAGLVMFRPEEPLAPGAELTIGFHHEGQVPTGATFGGGGASQFILPSGVVLHSFSPTFVPVIGFRDDIGVDGDNQSDPKEWEDDFYLGETVSLFGTAGKPYPVRTKVTGPAEFTINCVGVKRSDVVEGDRRTVVWETDAPVRFFNVVAGRWTEARGELGTAIYHHPDHTYNIEAMVDALDAAREHFGEWFHPYPWAELKISQFPGLAGYAQGFPTNITFSEAIGFLTKDEQDAADAPFLVTAHESAHQWWGNILCPGKGPGGNLLSEGTAHFSTLLLFEEERGLEARVAFSERIEDQYGERRMADSERPLVKIDGSRPGDTTVTYDKAGWVFWMLLNHMGRERCLEGMRSFIAHYVASRDHPVLQDFVDHMRPFAPDAEAYDTFTQQWFFEVVVPEYELRDVERRADDGGWVVTATIENKGTGTMPVEVCAAAGERFEDGYQDARTTVTLGAGEAAEVSVRSEFEPERLVVDPDAKVLQLRRKAARHAF